MHTFIQKPNSTPQKNAIDSSIHGLKFIGQHHAVYSLLRLHRMNSNRAMQQFPALPQNTAALGSLTDEGAVEPQIERADMTVGQNYPGPTSPTPGPGVNPVPVPACAIASHATIPAPDGTPDTRTTIGVCETIEFDAGGHIVDWSADKGWPQVAAAKSKLLWAAPETGGTARINAARPDTGETCILDMKVVPPSSIRYQKKSDEPVPQGHIGTVMKLEGTVHPLNVTFGWITTKEDNTNATAVTGYFRWLKNRHQISLAHKAGNKFVSVGWDNRFCCDTAGIRGPFPRPPRWRIAGSFQWIIPNRYQCDWSNGAGYQYFDATQSMSINAADTVTVSKEGASAP